MVYFFLILLSRVARVYIYQASCTLMHTCVQNFDRKGTKKNTHVQIYLHFLCFLIVFEVFLEIFTYLCVLSNFCFGTLALCFCPSHIQIRLTTQYRERIGSDSCRYHYLSFPRSSRDHYGRLCRVFGTFLLNFKITGYIRSIYRVWWDTILVRYTSVIGPILG